jgi:hypothetical protein
MTLNIILASSTAVYVSADFRISEERQGQSKPTPRPDNLDVQKLIPVVRPDWGGLLAYTGTWDVPRSFGNVGDWLAEQVDSLPLKSTPRDLQHRLLEANRWLGTRPPPRVSISFVGFAKRRPFVGLISNFLDDRYRPIRPEAQLRVSSFTPRAPCICNPWGLEQSEKSAFLNMLSHEPPGSGNVLRLLAETNAAVARRSDLVSEACVTGSVIASGVGVMLPNAIPPGPYFPKFLQQAYQKAGIAGLKPKLDSNGNPLPVRWVQSASRFDFREDVMIVASEIANVEAPIAGPKSPGMHSFWTIAKGGPTTLKVNLDRPPRRNRPGKQKKGSF